MLGFLLSYLLGILMLLGGGRNGTDLLDTLSTDVYWQMKHVTPELAQLEKDAGTDPAPGNIDALVKDLASPDFATRDQARGKLERLGPAILPLLKPVTESTDPEVAAIAQDLCKKFAERGQERAIRRLMAIRTLGERKEKDALPLLAGLKDSKDLFVADYARRSIAQINGEQIEPVDLAPKLAGDLALLPADAAVVGQTSGLGSQRLTIAGLIETAIANDPGVNIPVMPGIPAPKKPDAKQLIQQASEQLLTLLERVGNIRLDAVTVGFNYTQDNAKPPAEHGWFALIIRGQFDSASALAALKDVIGGNATITPAEKPGDIATIADKDDEAVVFVPNNQQVIIVTAPDEKEPHAARDAFLAALKTGKGTLDRNQDLAALMKTVDTKASLWAVCKFTDLMSKSILDDTFKSLTLDTKPAKDGTEFTVKAVAVDADKAKAAVEKVTDELKSAQDDLKQEVQAMPALQPIADLLASIKVSSEGDQATLTGTLPAGMLNAVMGQLPFLEILAPREPAPPMPQVAPEQLKE